MKTKSRIGSILRASYLDHSITGLPSFNLSALDLASDYDFDLPTNLRLGHLAEKVVSHLIKSSTNYKLLYESVQLIEDRKTIGELDFIIKDDSTRQIIHLEMAYKFYLYDPSLSSEAINNWIGPNRNDSLKEKLDKLKNKQLPLLYHNSTKSKLDNIELNDVSQKLCLLVSLFVPYEYKARLNSVYEQAIKGYYVNYEKFMSIKHSDKLYYLPSKLEWGIDPSKNENWKELKEIEEVIRTSIEERQALLCWQKQKDIYLSFFIVWW